jgi:lipid A disaccharide synthetase
VLYLSPALPESVRRFARQKAGSVPALEVRGAPGPELPGFDVALVASGTASLECVTARLPPVVAFRTDRISFALGQRLVRVEHVALPNIIANKRLFPELLQDRASPSALASAAETVLSNPADYQARCLQVRNAEAMQTKAQTSVSEILGRWLDRAASRPTPFKR